MKSLSRFGLDYLNLVSAVGEDSSKGLAPGLTGFVGADQSRCEARRKIGTSGAEG